MKKAERAAAEAKIRVRFFKMENRLTERARRLFVASEAMAFGHGGITAAFRATGMAASVIGRGIKEIRAIEAGLAEALPHRPGVAERVAGARGRQRKTRHWSQI